MFLVWLFVAIAIGVFESLKDSHDARKLHNDPKFRKQWGHYLDKK